MSKWELWADTGLKLTREWQNNDATPSSEAAAPTAVYYEDNVYFFKLVAQSSLPVGCFYMTVDAEGKRSSYKYVNDVLTTSSPRCVVHDGTLYIFYFGKDTSDSHFSFSEFNEDSGTFSAAVQCPLYQKLSRDQILAAVSFRGELHVFGVYLDEPHGIYRVQGHLGQRALDGQFDWTPLPVPGVTAAAPPLPVGAIVDQDRLLLFVLNEQQEMQMTTYDGETWTSPIPVDGAPRSGTGSGLALHRNLLQLVYTRRDKVIQLQPIEPQIPTDPVDAVSTAYRMHCNRNTWSPETSCSLDPQMNIQYTPAAATHLSTDTLYILTRT